VSWCDIGIDAATVALYADTTTPAERTWGLRSYESPSTDPKPG